jgi:hypothetical protein
MVKKIIIKALYSVHSLSAKDANMIKRAHEGEEPVKILYQAYDHLADAFFKFILCSH